ncbi:copper chaperone PCu(A)C [Thiomicrorhabdus xiamenensis]|uniref:Copper chaperone PCu(A)C n=1 Tax=Thiomicrorhabdus xiamenensis TaxID=2739063 RepID=A0A7D4TG86_9GAMM|nr:copper chaperone PCu(A)C [Thiomicrorhabdus xiamenensis]QKI89468.1 copper chaperone PCu(A)C [Thiomicrorhabdus xiamenensis]
MKKTLVALSFGVITSLSSFAALAVQADNISVENPFAREVPPTAPASASFMTLKNASGKDINLVQAHSEVARAVELHTHINDGGVMRMRQIDKITIPANGTTELKPGGLHIMLIGPHNPIKVGQTVTVDLEFADGSHKKVDMPVKSFMGMGMQNQQKGQHRCGSGMH